MSADIKGFVWTTKNIPKEKNTAAYRAYIFYGNNDKSRLYVPNINLVNHPLWVYHIRHKHNRWNVKKNEINYGRVPKKAILGEYYKKRGLNPYNIYVMASNILHARQKNQNKQNANRQQEIRSMKPGPQMNKKIKTRRESYIRHQDVINMWKNIKNISKNMIGKTNSAIRDRISRGMNRSLRPIPSQSKIKALQNLIPSYGRRTYTLNRNPSRKTDYYNGFNNMYRTNVTMNGNSVNSIKRQIRAAWNKDPNDKSRRPRIPPSPKLNKRGGERW